MRSLVFPHHSHREHVFSFTTNTLPGTASAISTYLLGPFSHTLDTEENIKQVFSSSLRNTALGHLLPCSPFQCRLPLLPNQSLTIYNLSANKILKLPGTLKSAFSLDFALHL